MHPYMGTQMTWKHNQCFNPDSGVSTEKLFHVKYFFVGLKYFDTYICPEYTIR